MRKTRAAVSILAALLLPLSALGTIEQGETRTVEGKVVAVDVSHRAVVLEVPAPKGDLTVGVTLAEGVDPRVGTKTVPLADVAVGSKAKLKYTRENGKLVGLELQVTR